jgi:hypothetical protein
MRNIRNEFLLFVLGVLLLGFAQNSYATVYYVNSGDIGANNANCNGLYATSSGGTNCPFRDFSSASVRSKLCSAANEVAVMPGTYEIQAINGVSGCDNATGNDNGLVIAYDGAKLTCANWSAGVPTVVIKPSFSSPAYNIVTMVGKSSRITNCELQGGTSSAYIVNFKGNGATSVNDLRVVDHIYARDGKTNDCAKSSPGSNWVEIKSSVFHGCASQAIDLTGAQYWYIHGNEFIGSTSYPMTGAIGPKNGAKDIEFFENYVHHTSKGVNFGGTGGTCTASDCVFAAENIWAHDNTFETVTGRVVQFYSCKNCTFEDNTITSSLSTTLGIEHLTTDVGETYRPLNTGNLVRSNSFVLSGSKTFQAAATAVLTSFASGLNTYDNGDSSSTWNFAIDGSVKTFSQWQTGTGTDSTSSTQ